MLFKLKPGRKRSIKDLFLKSRAWRHIWGMPEAQLLPRAKVMMLPALCCLLQWGRGMLLLGLFKVWRNLVLQKRGCLSRKNCSCWQPRRKRLRPVSMPLGGLTRSCQAGERFPKPILLRCPAGRGGAACPSGVAVLPGPWVPGRLQGAQLKTSTNHGWLQREREGAPCSCHLVTFT